MKKTLLSVVAIFVAHFLSAQCVPNPEYADEPFGIWPTPEEGFAVGTEGEIYTQVVDFKIPTSSGDIPGAPLATNIDSVQVASVEGLPEGLTFVCNSHSGNDCTFLPNVPGCAVITGVPTESGIFDLTINLNAFLTIFGTTPTTFQFTDFQIEIQGETAVNELSRKGLVLNQNAPNPFHDFTVVEFSLERATQVEFKIFNLLGKSVHQQAINANKGINRMELSASELGMTPGIYLYSLTIDGESVTRKMVVK